MLSGIPWVRSSSQCASSLSTICLERFHPTRVQRLRVGITGNSAAVIMWARTFAASQMSKSQTYVAFALHHGIVHLCLDSHATKKVPVESLCREVQLFAPRVQIEPGDLESIHNFIICKGCETRFNLLGYRGHYAPNNKLRAAHPDQLSLF